MNRRIKGGHWLRPEVRQAMEMVTDASFRSMESSNFSPRKTQGYTVEVDFWFERASSDVDGPLKRTIDATFAGMRKAIDSPAINDSRVVEITARKHIGEARTRIIVRPLDNYKST